MGLLKFSYYMKKKYMSPTKAFERGLLVLYSHFLDFFSLDLDKWEAPPNCLKLNVDRVVFSRFQIARVGSIVWDHVGKVILAASILEANVANAKSIEAIVILRGLQICMHQGIFKLIIKSDCLVVVEELSSGIDSNSELGNIYLDIKDLMSHFLFYKIQYGNHLGNIVAHSLARNTWHVNNISMWYDVIPPFLTQTICFDSLNL